MIDDPCRLLSEQDAARFGVVVGPRMLNGAYGGTRSICYWVTRTGIQFGWIPDPPAYVRGKSAKEPGARQINVSGYAALQTTKKDSCTQDVAVSPNHYFRTIINRVERPKGVTTGSVCQIANSVSELIIETLKALA